MNACVGSRPQARRLSPVTYQDLVCPVMVPCLVMALEKDDYRSMYAPISNSVSSLHALKFNIKAQNVDYGALSFLYW